MAKSPVSQEEVDELLNSGKLSVLGKPGWKRGAHKAWCRADIPVVVDDPLLVKKVSLRIIASISAGTDKRDFSLLLNGMRIRALCINGNHTNRHTNTEHWRHRTHKHKWTNVCMDRFAYTPTDITATDIQGQFAQFCAECGIACDATLAEVPATQGDLFDEM
jgi:hypothetical protein